MPVGYKSTERQTGSVEIHALDTRKAVRDAIGAHGHAWREAYADILPGSVLDQVTVDPASDEVDDWLARLPDEDDLGVAYGATVDGAVRGYVFVRWENTKSFVGLGEAELKELYVHPDWWGGGLGTSLLGAAVDDLPTGVDGLALEVLADNDVGRSFYESRGFSPDDDREIEIGDDTYKTIIYRRETGLE